MGNASKRSRRRGIQVGYTQGTQDLFKRYEEFALGLGAVEYLEAAGWTQAAPNWWVHEKTLADNPDETDHRKLGMPAIVAVAYEALKS